MTLNAIIELAKKLGTWIHEHTDGVEYVNDRRITTATGLALFQQSQDIGDAIIILIESNLPGPALALARPLHETYVRGVWLLNCASDDELDKFLTGKCPKFPELLKAIGDYPETGGKWIHAITDSNIKAFHDLTHGGVEHILRRVSMNSIEPNYPEEELIRLVQIEIEIRIAIGANLLALSNDLEGLEMLESMANYFRSLYQLS